MNFEMVMRVSLAAQGHVMRAHITFHVVVIRDILSAA